MSFASLLALLIWINLSTQVILVSTAWIATADDESHDRSSRPRRPEDQALWVDQQIRSAIARGEFDDLPYQGKPLPHIDTASRPNWWLEQFIERENITGVLPEAL